MKRPTSSNVGDGGTGFSLMAEEVGVKPSQIMPVEGISFIVLDENGNVLAGEALLQHLKLRCEEAHLALKGILARMGELRDQLSHPGVIDPQAREELAHLDERRQDFHLKHRIFDGFARAIERASGHDS